MKSHLAWLDESLPLLIQDPEGRVVAASQLAQTLLGVSHADLKGRSLESLDEVGVRTFPSSSRSGLWERRLVRSQRTEKAFELWSRDHPGGYRVSLLLPERGTPAAQHGPSLPPHLSHELRTPLQGILGLCELLDDMELSEEAREYVQMIEASARTLLGIVNEVLFFNALHHGKYQLKPERFNPHQVVLDLCRSVSTNAFLKHVDILIDVEPGFPETCQADRGAFWHVVFNLVGNAVKFTEKGHVLVTLSYEPADDALVVAVSDTGPGISLEDQKRIFEPFEQASTGTGRKHLGSGLGLSIVKQLVDAMNGSITVNSFPGKGSTFTLRLPGVQASPPEAGEDLTGRCCVVACSRPGLQSLLCRRLTSVGAQVYELQTLPGPEVGPVDLVADRDGLAAFQARAGALPEPLRLRRVVVLKYPGQGIPRAQGIPEPVCLTLPTSSLCVIRALLKGVDDEEAASAAPGGGQGKKVLLVEDTPIARRLVKRLLERAGFSVLTAASGPEAVQLATTQRVDAIVLDICMPEMDGLMVADIVRNVPSCPNRDTPIIALSADSSPALREAAWSRGVSYFLVKPVTGDELVATIQAALRGDPVSTDPSAREYLGALI